MGEPTAETAVVADELALWLRRLGGDPDSCQPLAGDVSQRRYLRLRHRRGSAVLALYPPSMRDACRRFLDSGRLLAGAAVPVPEVFAHDCGRGWMLLEDLGPRTLYQLAEEPWEVLARYLEAATALAERISALPAAEISTLNPPLDRALLSRELDQTWRVFLLPEGRAGDGATRERLATLLEELTGALASDEPVPCHRDYMARNLVPRGAGFSLAVLDHQDLRLGPPAYDLASLLNDSLYPPAEIEERLLTEVLPARSRLAYHRAALQRTLKAVGTFAAFAARGQERHLPLIPPTLARAHHHLARLPEGGALAQQLEPLWTGPRGEHPRAPARGC